MTSSADRVVQLRNSPLFPLDESGALKSLGPAMTSELPRDGEPGGKSCHSCGNGDRVLWTNGRWQIAALKPTANPVTLFLETVEHRDFETLDETMAAEFGVLTWRLETAIRTIEEVGRVHIHRWGDGSSHFHVWFQGRPALQLEMYGWGNVLWTQLLDPLPVEVLTENHRRVIEQFDR
jgi:hypothetical protein